METKCVPHGVADPNGNVESDGVVCGQNRIGRLRLDIDASDGRHEEYHTFMAVESPAAEGQECD